MIEPERGIVFCSGNLDLQYGACILSLEKWVQCFQEERFCASCRLGQFGARHQFSVKIQSSAVEVVGPAQVQRRTGHTKTQVRESHDAVAYLEVPFHLGSDTVDVHIFGLSLAFPAEHVDFPLYRRTSELSLADPEFPFQFQAFDQVRIPLWNIDLRSEPSGTGHNWVISLDGKMNRQAEIGKLDLTLKMCLQDFLGAIADYGMNSWAESVQGDLK